MRSSLQAFAIAWRSAVTPNLFAMSFGSTDIWSRHPTIMAAAAIQDETSSLSPTSCTSPQATSVQGCKRVEGELAVVLAVVLFGCSTATGAALALDQKLGSCPSSYSNPCSLAAAVAVPAVPDPLSLPFVGPGVPEDPVVRGGVGELAGAVIPWPTGSSF